MYKTILIKKDNVVVTPIKEVDEFIEALELTSSNPEFWENEIKERGMVGFLAEVFTKGYVKDGISAITFETAEKYINLVYEVKVVSV